MTILLCLCLDCFCRPLALSTVPPRVPVLEKHQCWKRPPGRPEALLWHCSDPLPPLFRAQGPGSTASQSAASCLHHRTAGGEQAWREPRVLFIFMCSQQQNTYCLANSTTSFLLQYQQYKLKFLNVVKTKQLYSILDC